MRAPYQHNQQTNTMALPIFINVKTGNDTVKVKTEATTIGELFTTDFRQNFNFADRASPTVAGVTAPADTPLVPEMVVSAVVGASSKS
tara:strand:+ start:2193 stop:2456 length:264 start_codon:yes stop_codon:yes gene_type:complete